MSGIVVKVDDRVILGALVSSIALYLGLSWHQFNYIARSQAGEAAGANGTANGGGEVSPTDRDQARASRLLELHFASLHDSERPFGDVPAIQVCSSQLCMHVPFVFPITHVAAMVQNDADSERPFVDVPAIQLCSSLIHASLFHLSQTNLLAPSCY